MSTTIDEQIKCAERELAMRERCYPRWIEQDRMRLDKAEHETACMRDIVATLKKVRDCEQGDLFLGASDRLKGGQG